MRVLITGGAGCLGSSLVERLVPAGHEVFVIDNFATGKREVLPDVHGLTVVEGNIADANLVDEAFRGFQPSHVIHSAAAYKDPDDWREDSDTNVIGTVNVVKAAERTGVSRIVYFQTALCYGRPDTVPIPVDHPLRPMTSYGWSKTAGEGYVALARVPWVSLRLANVTGPRLSIGPLPTFYKRLKAGQACFCTDAVRDFLDMEDFLAVVDRVLEDDAPSGVFNVSTGQGYTIRQIYEQVAGHLGLSPEVEVRPVAADDVPAVVLDPQRTEAELGWRAAIDFETTIGRMLQWYDAHGVTDVFSHLKASS